MVTITNWTPYKFKKKDKDWYTWMTGPFSTDTTNLNKLKGDVLKLQKKHPEYMFRIVDIKGSGTYQIQYTNEKYN